MDYKRLVGTNEGAKQLIEWIIRSRRLGQFVLRSQESVLDLSLQELLERSNYNATNPKDKIFALVSSSIKEREPI
jgi:hypothetical protein